MKASTRFDLRQLPPNSIGTVTFFKRDELTTDLICCEITTKRPGEKTYFFHEEWDGWDGLIAHLRQLPGFNSDWHASVSQPPFAENKTVACSAGN